MLESMPKEQYIDLNRQYIKYATLLPRCIAENAKLTIESDYFTQALVLELKSFVMSEKVENETYDVPFEYPSDWWQLLKKQKAPKWFLKRWPVYNITYFKRVTASKMVGYPELPLSLPDCGHQLRFNIWKGYD